MWFQHALSGGRLHQRQVTNSPHSHRTAIERQTHKLTFAPACNLQIKLTSMVGVGGSQKEPIQGTEKTVKPHTARDPQPTHPTPTHIPDVNAKESSEMAFSFSKAAKSPVVLN